MKRTEYKMPVSFHLLLKRAVLLPALLTKAENIYVGVCIDTASTLGMCAERNAIANMITNGEHEIDKLVAIVENGSVGSPCGTCREYMMQLSKNSGEIEILTFSARQ